MKSGRLRTSALGSFSVFLFFVTALLVFSPGLAQAQVTPVTVSCCYHQGRPDVKGSLVTWKRYISSVTGYEIYSNDLSNLSSPGEKDLTAGEPGDQINPVTNGSDVIWEDWATGSGQIYMNYLGSNQPLVTGPGNHGVLDISGSTAVFVSNPKAGSYPITDSGNKIYYTDLATKTPEPVDASAGATGAQWEARISGTKVVWMDFRSGLNWDIYEKDLSSGAARRLTSNGANNEFPDISGNIVVWRSYQNNQWDLHWMNLTDSVDHQFTNDAAIKQSVRISGALMVWMDARNDPNPTSPTAYDIYSEDLNTGTQSILAPRSTNPAYPAIDRGSVVWEDDPSGAWAGYRIMAAALPEARISLNLVSLSAYWATEADYQSRLLSVKYTVAAPVGSAIAQNTQILASSATSGVALSTPVPVQVGTIQPGAQATAVLKYLVPSGVSSFDASVFASAQDVVGDISYFPGPPPGS